MLIGLSISAAAEGRAFGAPGMSLNSKLMLNIHVAALGSKGLSRNRVLLGKPTQSVSQPKKES